MLPPLSPADEKLLLTFADPEAPAAIGGNLAAQTLLALLANAEFNGVLPIMLRKLRQIGAARLPQDAALQGKLS